MTILSTIHPSFLSVSPGDGLFILPLTTSKAALRPFPVAWLYAVTEEDCPPPPFFVTLGAALGPGTDLYVSGIFQQAWALGPHARVYLNSSQLPLPYFRRTDDLQVHTNNRAHGADFGGYGAKQYHFVFSPDIHDKVSFANLPVTPEALPESFLNDLLALENWLPAATLLATPNNTISWPDNSSLRMWLPDVDSNFSPHHGITICCGRAGDRASLTALLWATATFTKSQPTGRRLFGTHTFPMFLSMNLWPWYFTVLWNIGLDTPRTPFHAPPLTQS